jgi:hypothetical protein
MGVWPPAPSTLSERTVGANSGTYALQGSGSAAGNGCAQQGAELARLLAGVGLPEDPQLVLGAEGAPLGALQLGSGTGSGAALPPPASLRSPSARSVSRPAPPFLLINDIT